MPRTGRRIRPRHRRRWWDEYSMPPTRATAATTTTGIDVARFALLSVATLPFPFTVWIARFTHDYAYRVSICREALTGRDPELASASRNREDRGGKAAGSGGGERRRSLLGRERELAEASDLLDRRGAVADTGDRGAATRRESRRSCRSCCCATAATTIVAAVAAASRTSSSLSSASTACRPSRTRWCARSTLRWLRLRRALVDVLPFAGSEILVTKERFGGPGIWPRRSRS